MLALRILVFLLLSGFIFQSEVNHFEHLIVVQRVSYSTQLVHVSENKILNIPAVENLQVIFEPQWSSDYQYLAFLMGSEETSFDDPLLYTDVFLLEYKTGVVTRLTQDILPTNKTGIMWGPNNANLIVASASGIESIALETRERTVLVENKTTEGSYPGEVYYIGARFTGNLILNRFMSFLGASCRQFNDCNYKIFIYDFTLMSIIHEIDLNRYVLDVVVSPDMTKLVSLGIGEAFVYSIENNEIITSISKWINICTFPDEDTIYCVANDEVYTIDLESGNTISQTLIGTVSAFGFGRTSDLLLFLDGNTNNPSLTIYDPLNNTYEKVFDDIFFVSEEMFGFILSGRVIDW